MDYATLKSRLRSLINRRDFTEALAGTFVNEALSVLERRLRIGPMEIVIPVTGWDGVNTAITTPPGFLETIALFTDDIELEQADLHQWLAIPDLGGKPTHFVRTGNRWQLRPTPAADARVFLNYYSESPPLALDADTGPLVQAAGLAILYTAATLAADHFQLEDQYASRWAAKAEGYVTNLELQDWNEKWSGRLTVPIASDHRDF
jgi:hypothetical protein